MMMHKFLLGMSMLLPEQASSYAADVDNLYLFLVGLTIFFTVLICAAIIYFFVKFRRKVGDPIPAHIEGSVVLESIWSIIPFIICLFIFAWGVKIYLEQYTIPNDAADIYVVGKQWMWKFQHPEGQREINEVHIPIGRKVRFVCASEDVIHSFYVPAFRMKEDVVPGPSRYSTVWCEPTMTGTFHIFCAEYCGTSHSAMIGTVTVMSDGDYQAWLSGGAAQGSMADRGASLFQQFGCITCHKSDATGQCPKLEGKYGVEEMLEGGGKATVDDGYIRESILSPMAKVVLGFKPVMPSFQGQVSEEQIQQLIAYIKSIGPAPTATAAGAAKAGAAPVEKAPPIMMSGGRAETAPPASAPSTPTAPASATKSEIKR